ncbi:MAG: hypothetical protein SWO11_17485 [Thermodesulfobacteriota bacterium]|nr:hypothetical protein [Thermodesulfobacteriota bacterium]
MKSYLIFISQFAVPLSLFCFSITHAAEAKSLEGLSLGIGIERLKYEEDASDIGVKSHSQGTNTLLKLMDQKGFGNIFAGIKGIFPIHTPDDKEKWTEYGELRQSNTMEYYRQKMDIYAGYSLMSWLSPYTGLSWLEAEQKRENFIIYDVPVSGSATEKLRSYDLLFGIYGCLPFGDRVQLDYRIDYLVPVDSTVKNNYLFDFEVKDNNGYTLEITNGIRYIFKESLSIYMEFNWGKIHWDQSDWATLFGGIRVKTPDNDSTYTGAILGITYHL